MHSAVGHCRCCSASAVTSVRAGVGAWKSSSSSQVEQPALSSAGHSTSLARFCSSGVGLERMSAKKDSGGAFDSPTAIDISQRRVSGVIVRSCGGEITAICAHATWARFHQVNIFRNIFSNLCVQSMQVILFGCTTCIYAALDYAWSRRACTRRGRGLFRPTNQRTRHYFYLYAY